MALWVTSVTLSFPAGGMGTDGGKSKVRHFVWMRGEGNEGIVKMKTEASHDSDTGSH